jgi:hypothetical protein
MCIHTFLVILDAWRRKVNVLGKVITSYHFSKFSFGKQLYVLFCCSTSQFHMTSKVTLKLFTKCWQLGDAINFYCVLKFFLGEAIAAPCSAGVSLMIRWIPLVVKWWWLMNIIEHKRIEFLLLELLMQV